jgi:anti-anti-sigma regulatory factor
MTLQVCNVEVKQLPDAMSPKRARRFLSEYESHLNVDRPCIILDCSKVLQMDRSFVHLLLCCLEEAIKRNGDVKLSEVPAAARAVLDLTGVNRLFEVFDTNADALSSFHRFPVNEALHQTDAGGSCRAFENAA